jgi:hypothetical protein
VQLCNPAQCAANSSSYCLLTCDKFNHPFFCDRNHPQDIFQSANPESTRGTVRALHLTLCALRRPAYPLTQFVRSQWNHLIDAILSVNSTRAMYVRRLRTIMDEFLAAGSPPNTCSVCPLRPVGVASLAIRRRNLRAALSGIIEKEAKRLLGRIEADVALDRKKWKTKGAVAGVTQLLRQILPYRRHTLFIEHGPEGSGLIPESQQLVLNVSIKTVALHATEAGAAEDYVELFNAQHNGAAVDLSGWYLTAGVDAKYVLPPGAVIPANRSCFIAADPAAFRRARDGVQSGHLVLGPIRKLSLGIDSILVSLFDKDNYAGERRDRPV